MLTVSPEAAVYPPGALLLMQPFCAFPWPAAGVAFDWLSALVFLAAGCALVFYVGWYARFRQQLAVAALLTIPIEGTSVRETLLFGNPALLCTGLAALALLPAVRRSGHASPAGALLLGLALALKPQLAAPVLLFLLGRNKTRRTAWWALGCFSTVFAAAAALYRLRLGSFTFLSSWDATCSWRFNRGTRLIPRRPIRSRPVS